MRRPRKPPFNRRQYIAAGRQQALRLVAAGKLVQAVQHMLDHLQAHQATRPHDGVLAQLQPRLIARAERGDKVFVVRFLERVS